MHLFQRLIVNTAVLHVIKMCVMGLLWQIKPHCPINFADVVIGVISMDLVVLAMKEGVLFCAQGAMSCIQQTWHRSNSEKRSR